VRPEALGAAAGQAQSVATLVGPFTILGFAGPANADAVHAVCTNTVTGKVVIDVFLNATAFTAPIEADHGVVHCVISAQ
jgi:hypothetical protein